MASALLAVAPQALPGRIVDELRCDGLNAIVRAADARDARTACEGAADAVRFLGGHGLKTSEPINVRVVDELPHTTRSQAQGCYLHRERTVYVRSFRTFRRGGDILRLPADRVLYRSVITHEVGHAIAACNFSVARPTLQAQEYIAYVTMFSTMPEKHRKGVLQKIPGAGFGSEREINVMIYLMDSDFFGAQAYRHFLKPENGPAFLHQVMSGNALAWDDLL
jgi:hypothetical protein